MNALLQESHYHSELFGCLSDCRSCFYGLFCPCCLNASNLALIRKENCTPYHLLLCFSPFWIRQMVKEQNNIKSSYCADCVLTTLCTSCVICQDSREIRWRNLQPTEPNI